MKQCLTIMTHGKPVKKIVKDHHHKILIRTIAQVFSTNCRKVKKRHWRSFGQQLDAFKTTINQKLWLVIALMVNHHLLLQSHSQLDKTIQTHSTLCKTVWLIIHLQAPSALRCRTSEIFSISSLFSSPKAIIWMTWFLHFKTNDSTNNLLTYLISTYLLFKGLIN